MKVNIVYRDGWHISIRTVVISDNCPQCGGPRGKPSYHRFHEDGEWYGCDTWDNPCGHLDKYADCFKEAESIGVETIY